ncbi:type III-B CRISPR module RAMP protein Cmr1 [Insolitispirillum peregrinum]|uniref:type III-B CRISPR module RAMP protein Cmr1 n=1 Tax=Insolitispirillum peregrinum TaxID=80876 RepID=UPI00360EED15
MTRIIGGGTRPRTTDDIDYIRPGSVRGHLRFWWRALQEPGLSSADLYEKECALWGGATSAQSGGRSAVELRIKVRKKVKGRKYAKDEQSQETIKKEGYVTWTIVDAGKSVEPGMTFTLTLIAPQDRMAEVRDSVAAWILFGGYGGRTRRGAGTLRPVDDDAARWLPRWDANPQTFLSNLNAVLPNVRFGADAGDASQTPSLYGADILVGPKPMAAMDAWHKVIACLQEFRQGASGNRGLRAREPGVTRDRPSISNWPEADKVRQLPDDKERHWSHRPRYNAQPAWPRAGFGLPIIGRFQRKSANHTPYTEPGDFTIGWIDSGGTAMNRLASPVIIKALPLADGKFIPCVLWLRRAWPEGQVGLQIKVQGKDTISEKSRAPFDRLLGDGDTALFAPLEKPSLREAFLGWLVDIKKMKKVSP